MKSASLVVSRQQHYLLPMTNMKMKDKSKYSLVDAHVPYTLMWNAVLIVDHTLAMRQPIFEVALVGCFTLGIQQGPISLSDIAVIVPMVHQVVVVPVGSQPVLLPELELSFVLPLRLFHCAFPFELS